MAILGTAFLLSAISELVPLAVLGSMGPLALEFGTPPT